jgi:hypothetical protein
VADVEEARSHSLKFEISDEVGRSVQIHIAEMHLITAVLREQSGNERADLSCPED